MNNELISFDKLYFFIKKYFINFHLFNLIFVLVNFFIFIFKNFEDYFFITLPIMFINFLM